MTTMSPDQDQKGEARDAASHPESGLIKAGTMASTVSSLSEDNSEEVETSPSRGYVIVSMNDLDVKSEKMPEQRGNAASVAEPYPGHIHSLHPMSRILTVSDLDSCCVLEEVAFRKPEERCSREKFNYRLSTCGELCLGIFTTATPGLLEAATLATSRPVETGRDDGGVGVLLAHIIATKTTANVVTDEAMDYPADWNSGEPTASTKGHQAGGRTICLHSLAVDPSFQGKTLGRTLLGAYIGQMNGAGIADRIALIAREHTVPFYERLKFVNKGPSKCEFGGGNWIDMVYELHPHKAVARYG